MENVLTIDPGLNGTGWAYWQVLTEKEVCPTTSGVITVPRNHPIHSMVWTRRCHYIAGALHRVVPLAAPPEVYLEVPRLFSNNAVSLAAGVKGDLTKLTYLCGVLGAEFVIAEGVNIHALYPDEWKGQMNKAILRARVAKVLPMAWHEHELDAVGIGLYLIGKL